MRRSSCVLSLVLGLSACADASAPADVGEIREWRPEDHGQPTEVDPTRVPTEAPAEQPADPARAVQALWKVACASCHGVGGRGAGPSLPPGASVPSFSDAAWQSARTDEALADTIKNGRNLMPAFGKQITDDGIGALVKHIRSLQQ